jgi:hypothetical protein
MFVRRPDMQATLRIANGILLRRPCLRHDVWASCVSGSIIGTIAMQMDAADALKPKVPKGKKFIS